MNDQTPTKPAERTGFVMAFNPDPIEGVRTWTITGRRTDAAGVEHAVTSISLGVSARDAIDRWLAVVQPGFRPCPGEPALVTYARHELSAEVAS